MVVAMRSQLLLLGLAPLLFACPVEEEPVCEAAPWVPGELAFRDATTEWGLDGVKGVRVSVTDIDGDGWPDLLTRNGGGPDDYVETQNRFVLRNDGDGGFEDVAEASGLFTGRVDGVSGTRPGELMMSGDVDNDGDLDVWTASNRDDIAAEGIETSELMLNDGDGTFSLPPDNVEWASVLSIPVGATFADVDLDGNLDVFVANNKRGGDSFPLQDRLFLGLGDGRFAESTIEMGLETRRWDNIDRLNNAEGHSWGWSAAACDLNNDGLPELLAASYGRAPNHLFQAREGGSEGVEFRNRSVEAGYAFDHRDEWWTNINAQCYCEDNPSAEDCDLAPTPEDYSVCQQLFAGLGGQYRWTHSSDREPWRLGGNSATTTCADLDNDGFLDLFTGEIVHWDVGPNSDPAEAAYNTGEFDVRFERPERDDIGLSKDREGTRWDDGDMNNAVFDFDNDGRQDIYLSSSDYPETRGWLFHQLPDGTFERVDLEDGIDHWRSAGAAPVDLDRDGDLDLVVGHTRMRCGGSYPNDCYDQPIVKVFENLADGRNHSVAFRLEGTGATNRAAVGARITVQRCEETLTRQVDGGHGIVGTQDDQIVHFGVGHDTEVEVTVHWPDAARSEQTFTVPTGAMYDVRQGDDPVEWSGSLW